MFITLINPTMLMTVS